MNEQLPTAPNFTRPVNWRILQTIVWLIGLAIFLALIFTPEIGIHAFWNVLIPVAPALLVLAPGLWRNICPLASTALLPRHLHYSRRIPISQLWHGRLLLLGVILLFTIVPLRHVALDTSGTATALAITFITLLAVIAGFLFEWKSGWCSGLCPVHPVEKLYGSATPLTFNNAHCHQCQRCVLACPDALRGTTPLRPPITSKSQATAGTIMVGGFPGFIWGWFHVPDYPTQIGWTHLDLAYTIPLAAAGVTLSLFIIIQHFTAANKRNQKQIHRIFAAAAVSCYYWYRLPALIGFGLYPGDGMLFDLSQSISPAVIPALRILGSIIFLWILVGRGLSENRWLRRPPFATTA